MQGDARVIEYLNRGLRHELAAINQYWLHYRLLDNWGYRALAKKWRQESIEEMQHADKLVVRIIFLDGFPNMQVIDPLRIGQNVREVLDCDLAAEMSARALYQEAATQCDADRAAARSALLLGSLRQAPRLEPLLAHRRASRTLAPLENRQSEAQTRDRSDARSARSPRHVPHRHRAGLRHRRGRNGAVVHAGCASGHGARVG